MVLVGTNGAGKTNALSIIADGLIEVAALHFQNITSRRGMTRDFFRTLGGRTQRIEAQFELSALKFVDGSHEFYYRAKSGTVSPDTLARDMEPYQPVASWGDENIKNVVGPVAEIERIFATGSYIFFPSTRFEAPYWANLGMLARDPEGDFTLNFTGNLGKPIVVQTAVNILKPWIIILMLDTVINAADVFTISTVELIRAKAQMNMSYYVTYHGLNRILKSVLRRQDASINWLNRSFRDRRIAVLYGNNVGMPSIDNLSSGQSSLFSVFGTVLHYGDDGQIAIPLDRITGLVIIDEADSHLHADLQHDVLPELIRMFPRVQFIVTSHSPLFPLGMQKIYGADGFTLIELPSGTTIDAERFSEFKIVVRLFQGDLVL